MPPKKSASSSDECVRVVVRVRPRNDGEMRNNNKVIVNMISESAQVCVERPDGEKQYFTFDSVYDHDSRQDTLFDETARPIIDSVIEGYNGTIFAYGQTGTGKTHTMEGRWEPPELRGITPRAFVHVFDRVAGTAAEYLVRASYLEIYNEEVRDLLSKDPKTKLELKEHPELGTYVKDLSSFPVRTVQEMEQVLNAGKKNRSVGATLMNQDSSRSHSIFTIIVESSAVRADGQKGLRAGKLNLVDLAGSERQSKTGATGDRLTEATKINASLSALGNVISALVAAKAGHVPYRDSKLTRLLQDSLGGNTKTVMVANLGPADYNFDETMSTLRYADRAKQIKNKPRINEDPKDTMIREFQAEIEKLRAQVATGGGGGGGGSNSAESERLVRQIEMEKAAISQQKDLAESEKLRISRELELKHSEILAERQKTENAAMKLRAMEEKLMHGGQNLLQKTEQQELELKEKERKLEEERLEKRRLERKMEEMEEAALQDNQKFGSIQEELENKSDKLKKLFSKYQRMKAELRDIQVEFERDKEEMLDQIRSLNKEVKQREIVIRHFIPPSEVRKIESRCRYDEDNDEWVLDKQQLTGNSIRRPQSASVNGKRPVSAAAKAAARMGVDNPRFKSENVLTLELDMPDRTTRDYDDRGFDDGEVFSVPAIPNVYFSYPSERDGAFGDDQRGRQRSAGSERGSGGSARPSSAARRDKPKTAQGSRPEATAAAEEYPSAKGPGRR